VNRLQLYGGYYYLDEWGGHQGLKNKGLPGWQTLWKGYSFFQSQVIGFKYANNSS